jgi:hypothetical protein
MALYQRAMAVRNAARLTSILLWRVPVTQALQQVAQQQQQQQQPDPDKKE